MNINKKEAVERIVQYIQDRSWAINTSSNPDLDLFKKIYTEKRHTCESFEQAIKEAHTFVIEKILSDEQEYSL